MDETNSLNGEISWVSPVARALLRSRVGDSVRLDTPEGRVTLEIEDVQYPPA
ncbi:MAG: GreA/GreB family elongation factor [Burkholderiaceae bacterium]